MALGFLAALFGRRVRLPRDQVTRVPRAARKAAQPQIDAMVATIVKIGALPGIADVKDQRRVPRGFHGLVEEYLRHYDAYLETVRKYLPVANSKRPGEPGGCNACFEAPFGLSSLESLQLYRKLRTWKDFPAIAQRMAELGEAQFRSIQSGHKGKDPEKIRLGSHAVQMGRLTFTRERQRCPLLDESKQRCRAWDDRPIVCRMHHPVTPADCSDPAHDAFPSAVKAYNIRPPLRVQLEISKLEKRLALQISPLMYAGLLQLVQLAEGAVISEVGEAPVRMQQDGRVAGRANRNVAHAKKFHKKKRKR